MRVVHIVGHGGKNGVVTSCHRLIAAQQDHGHEILLVTMPRGWLTRKHYPKPLKLVESSLQTQPREIIRVGHIIRDWKATVIHCHASKANKYGLVYRATHGAPALTTAHSRKIQLPFALLRAVISPSNQTARFHMQYNRVPASKITVIPHLFSDLEPTTTGRTISREALGLTADSFVIGMLGSIETRKNQIDALHILDNVIAKHPDTRLVIVGGFQEREPMPGWNEMISRPEIRDRLILTGHREDAAALLEAFDTLLCTSKVEEGPIAVLEAMSLRIPIVSYLTGLVADMIRDGIDGLVVPVGNIKGATERICDLIESPELRKKIGDQGRLRLEQECDERKILEQIDAVYERVARASGTWSEPD